MVQHQDSSEEENKHKIHSHIVRVFVMIGISVGIVLTFIALSVFHETDSYLRYIPLYFLPVLVIAIIVSWRKMKQIK